MIICTTLKKSQTLVEVLVAIGITVIALIGILNIALSYLALGGQTAERTIANYLAREGIEISRIIRDSQWLNPIKVWPYGLENDKWIAQYDDTSFTAATFSGDETIENCTNCQLYLTSDGFYNRTQTGTATIFRRMITISTGDDLGTVCNSDCEKKIEVKVYWTERGRSHQITLESRLTNWR